MQIISRVDFPAVNFTSVRFDNHRMHAEVIELGANKTPHIPMVEARKEVFNKKRSVIFAHGNIHNEKK